MTKALLLLKELKKEGVKRWYYGYIDNAISELKELEKPKSCKGCAFSREYTNKYFECTLLSYPDREGYECFMGVEETFYCNKYKAKETK